MRFRDRGVGRLWMLCHQLWVQILETLCSRYTYLWLVSDILLSSVITSMSLLEHSLAVVDVFAGGAGTDVFNPCVYAVPARELRPFGVAVVMMALL